MPRWIIYLLSPFTFPAEFNQPLISSATVFQPQPKIRFQDVDGALMGVRESLLNFEEKVEESLNLS